MTHLFIEHRLLKNFESIFAALKTYIIRFEAGGLQDHDEGDEATLRNSGCADGSSTGRHVHSDDAAQGQRVILGLLVS